ncbi:MAG: multicopper oxidase domain-containing protein [Nostocaceae cyanobacterium]|nr:multicopper oxidase domain-containing protein [Nostocaceae cyanobacterium]
MVALAEDLVSLKDAYIIGQENFDLWSDGIETEGTGGYLKVLPTHDPENPVIFKDPFIDWQNDEAEGTYYSSWGEDGVLELTLDMDDLEEIEIDGFGTLKAGDGIIPWFGNKETPYDSLMGYNGLVPGPMLIVEPGDKIRIKLNNNLEGQATNFHAHGMHVSPMGHGDNVLSLVESKDSWDIEIDIPDGHSLGPSWYHPHLHGKTTEQLEAGLAGFIVVNPNHDLEDIDNWNPKEENMFFMAINSFGIQQTNRPGRIDDPSTTDKDESDPLNATDPSLKIELPAGTPLQVNGDGSYELSDAVFVGFNAKPIPYDPKVPTGDRPNGNFEYGGGPLKEPVENVIHTVNGQYNPTIQVETGEWNRFSLGNFASNAFHVVQLVKDDGNGNLTLEEFNVVGLDGDTIGLVEEKARLVTETPLLNPGTRISLLHAFEEAGTYYFLSNGTEEILGDDTSSLIDTSPDVIEKGFADGHLIWGSQVLATVEVTGETVEQPDFPETYEYLEKKSDEADKIVEGAEVEEAEGTLKERTYVWYANLGGAIAEGNNPDDLEVLTFEGTYTINGGYFTLDNATPIALPMLGETERWTLINESGLSIANASIDEEFPEGVPDIPLVEWHPFHIHQNEFIVTEINGISVEEIKGTYLDKVFSDTIAMPPTYAPDSANRDNPYGVPQVDGIPSEIKILMNFKDFPGSYVNHCHILFHEDAGMMTTVRVILNTRDTWLGFGSNDNGYVELIRASNIEESIQLTPYGKNFKGGIDLAIGDINYKNPFDNQNVTDNVTDIVTIQHSVDRPGDKFTVKVFDGRTLIEEQEEGKKLFNGGDPQLLIKEFQVFQGMDVSPERIASVATGDINGDGFSDIVVGIGGEINPRIEVYSGKDYQLISKIDAFHHHEGFKGKINLAAGDVNGDNFDDIIVGQGAGGKGLVEVYSGVEIDALIRENPADALDARKAAHETVLFKDFKAYGDSYTGEVEVTSGYVLQTPYEPNGAAVQTQNANITTLAVDGAPDGYDQVQVFTYTASAHYGSHGSSDESGDSTDSSHDSGHEGHGSSHDSGHEGHGSSDAADDIRLDASFTPDGDIKEISGTFADIPDGDRGQSSIFSRQEDGNYQLVYLQEENKPTSIDITATAPPPKPPATVVSGTSGNDVFDAADPSDSFDGNNNILFAGGGEDYVDTTIGVGKNRIFGGRDGDEFFVGERDRVFGGKGDDEFYAINGRGGNRMSGGGGNDTFYLGAGDRALGGAGDDKFYVQSGGDNILVGGAGADQFWIANGDLPDAPNTIIDFNIDEDVIGVRGIGASSKDDLTFSQDGGNTLIGFGGTDLAILRGIQANNLQDRNFAFIEVS